MSSSIPPLSPLSSSLDSSPSIERAQRDSCSGSSSSVSALLSGQDAVIRSGNRTISLFSSPETHTSYDKSPSPSPTNVNTLEGGYLSDKAATQSLFLQPLVSISSASRERESGMSVSIPPLSPLSSSLDRSPSFERARRDSCRGSGSSASTLLSKRDAVIRSGNSTIPLFSGPEINTSYDQSPSTSPTRTRGHLEILSDRAAAQSVFLQPLVSTSSAFRGRESRRAASIPPFPQVSLSTDSSPTTRSIEGVRSHRRGRASSLSSEDTGQDEHSEGYEPISTPSSSSRQAPPMGKRRVFVCTTEGGIIQTECYFEGMTCIYDPKLSKSREALLKLPNVFPRYMTCLLEQTTYCPLNQIWEVIEDVVAKEKPVIQECDQQLAITRNFKVIQSLFRLQRSVANMIHYKVGKFVSELNSENKNIPRHAIVSSLCNEAGRAKEALYTTIVTRCSQAGCSHCRGARLFDSLGRHGTNRVTPCITTQACCRLFEIDYQNFTPTFFRQCAHVANLPFYSPVARSSELPSCIRTSVAPTAARVFESLLKHPLSSLTSGYVPVFPLGVNKSAVEAVQYSDGDGGFIVIEHFDYFKEYIHNLPTQPSVVFLREHGYSLLQFRELFHDAVELAHEYEIMVDGQQSTHLRWGYEALVNARANIARSIRLWLVPTSLDASGNRLLIELFTLEPGELMPHSTGVRQLSAGLSYLTNNSPSIYKEAWTRAVALRNRIHKYNLGEIPELHPISLKQKMSPRDGQPASPFVRAEVAMTDGTMICTVRNNSNADYLNEANIWILKSTLCNAGLGLFLKPTSLFKQPICIPPKTSICVYSSQPTDLSASQITNTDYLIEVERRGKVIRYNPDVYDGQNIGRFVNQGGLLEGIREMALCCDRQQGGRGIQQGTIHKVMEEHCNTAYQILPGRVLHVVSLKRLQSSNSPTELLANYSFTYWTKYITSHCTELGFNNPIVYGLLWCYLSQNSLAYGTEDFDTSHIPNDIQSQFLNMECPFRQTQRRRDQTVNKSNEL